MHTVCCLETRDRLLIMQVLFAGTLGRDEKTKKLLYQGDEQIEVRRHSFIGKAKYLAEIYRACVCV
jgi:hypothetical protein